MIYPSGFEQKLGFDRIRDLIRKRCLSPLGESRAEAIAFAESFDLITENLAQTAEFLHILQFEDDFPVDHYIDVTQGLKKARVEGMYLEVQELFDLRCSLETIKSLLNFFKARDESMYTSLRKLLQGVKVYPAILDRINIILTSNGRIKDNASKELGTIRASMRSAQERINKRMHSILKDAQSQGWIDKEASLTVRDGRVVLPVNATDKRKIKGFIHDESATGKTCFIEPAEIVETNNELKELGYDEQREIVHILVSFTDFLRPYLDDLSIAYEFMGGIDFIRAKALFALDIRAIKPVVVDEPMVEWKQAYHPLLYLNHKKEGKPVIPLDIMLTPEQRILVISGPNAGGKSVCLQSLGLIQYMLQCGILVPVAEGTVFGIFRDILIDIGDEQSIDNDLSTYSSHLLNMKHFVRHAGTRSLVLIDEMGAGTEPLLGGAIAEAILDKLNKNDCFGVITTHYGNLKHFASSAKGLVNGAMLFDTGKMEPLYKLEIGKPGSSFAFEISRRIGLPEEILQQAKEKVGEDHINFDKHLKEILRDKYYWERKRHSIRQDEKKLEEVVKGLEEELEMLKKQRKEILSKAKTEAGEILSGANKLIENTIREIRETGADKEKTKEVRHTVEKGKAEILKEQEGDEKSLKQIEEKLGKNRRMIDHTLKKEKKPVKVAEEMAIKKGDKVKMINQDTLGEVLGVNGKSIMVAFGHMITTLNERKLEKVTEGQFNKQQKRAGSSLSNWSLEKKLDFKTEIDLRGKRAEEALQEVGRFIDEALMLNVGEVRILHGKGNGILRQLIRDYLKTVDLVSSVEDAQADRGGTGISIVHLGE